MRDATLDVFTTVLCEVEPVPDALVELLLVSLLPSSRKGAPATHALAQQVVRRSSDALTRPVAAWLNGCLSLTPTEGVVSPDGPGKPRRSDTSNEDEDEYEDAIVPVDASVLQQSDASSNAYALVYELHLVEPRLLLYTLPKVAERLVCDDAKTRDATVTLLGRLFAEGDYATAYPAVYAEWLRRFTDKDAELRAKMVRVALKVAAANAKARADLLGKCALRLNDPSWDVRRDAVRGVADAVLEAAPDGLDDVRGGEDFEGALAGLRDRAKDRRAEIRKEALTGLASLYRAHVSKRWDDAADGAALLEEDEDDDDAPARGGGRAAAALAAGAANGGAAARLRWVPSLLLQSFGAACNRGDVSDRARLLVDEHLFDRDANAEERAAHVLGAVLPSLRDAPGAADAFGALLASSARHRGELETYLDAREAARAAAAGARPSSVAGSRDTAAADPSAAADAALEACHARLAALCPTPDGKTSLLRELSNVRDKRVFKALRVVCDGSADLAKRREKRADAVARINALGPKHRELGKYVAKLGKRAADAVVDAGALAAALALAAERLRDGADGDVVVDGAAALAALVAAHHPKLLAAEAASRALAAYVGAAAESRDAASFVAGAKAIATLAATEDTGALATSLGPTLARVAAAARSDLRFDDDGDDDGDGFFAECAKEAVSALRALDGDGRGDAVLRDLDGDDWDYEAPRLVARLRALGRCASAFPRAVAASDVVDRAAAELIESRPPADLAFAGGPKKGRKKQVFDDSDDDSDDGDSPRRRKRRSVLLASDFGAPAPGCAFAPAFLALRAALKAVAYRAAAAAAGAAGDGRRAAALDLLFGVLASKGAPPSGATASPGERAELRLTAASAALKLALAPAAAPLVGAGRWRSLSAVCLDAEPVVRSNFTRKLARAVLRGDAPVAKWGGALCLAALPSVDEIGARRGGGAAARKEALASSKQLAARALGVAVARARRAHGAAAARLPAGAAAADRDALARRHLPEYALFYAVHLLAKRPMDGASEGDEARAKALLDDKPTMRALLFVLDPLVASLGADADNVAFLLSCCNEMAAHDDAEDDDMTLSVRAVAAHAGELVKRQYVKTVDNLRPFPGVVYLPTALYAPPKAGRGDAVALRRKIQERAHDSVAGLEGAPSARKRKPAAAAKRSDGGKKPRASPKKRATGADDSDDEVIRPTTAKDRRSRGARESEDDVRAAAARGGVAVLEPREDNSAASPPPSPSPAKKKKPATKKPAAKKRGRA